MLRYLGVDPGKSGGIAIVDEGGRIVVAERMPETERDLLDLLRNHAPADRTHALLEKVHAAPKMGVSSAFTFGRGYGALLMALTALELPFDLTSPHKWQAEMGCLAPKSTEFGKKDKNINKRRAQQVFPSAKVTHAISDALLLAEYCRRLRTSPPQEKEF